MPANARPIADGRPPIGGRRGHAARGGVRVLERLELVELTRAVLHRAAQPMPVPLGTLNAIHLATAEMWREAHEKDVAVATHDRALALAARSSGFRVAGVD